MGLSEADIYMEGGFMHFPSTKGLEKSFQQLDRAVKLKKRGDKAEMAAVLEALIESQNTLNPNLSTPNHNRDLHTHINNFII
jgi:hypothetical protein